MDANDELFVDRLLAIFNPPASTSSEDVSCPGRFTQDSKFQNSSLTLS